MVLLLLTSLLLLLKIKIRCCASTSSSLWHTHTHTHARTCARPRACTRTHTHTHTHTSWQPYCISPASATKCQWCYENNHIVGVRCCGVCCLVIQQMVEYFEGTECVHLRVMSSPNRTHYVPPQHQKLLTPQQSRKSHKTWSLATSLSEPDVLQFYTILFATR